MRNILKRNSKTVNVGSLDYSEKQTEKEVETYKPIFEDIKKDDSNPIKAENGFEKTSLPPLENLALKSEVNSTTDQKMTQEDAVNDGADEQMLRVEDNDKLTVKRDEVKFIKGDHQNGDAKIDIGGTPTPAFTGMTKEELMKYANDPFWVRLRWIFFITFWLIWLAMLGGAIFIIIDAPKCAPPAPLPWYKRGLLAKFSTFSVADDDIAKVQKMKAAGAIYELPAEFTYTVRDADVEKKIKDIVNRYNDIDVNIVFDIVPNFVPKQSRIMTDALADETKRSAFIWIENPEAPNKWLSLVNGSAWSEVLPGNYVLSQFGDGLYDLRMNDTIVKRELSDVLRHLAALGVKGIRMKNSKFYILSKDLQDEVPSGNTQYDLTDYRFWTHFHTTFQEGLGDTLYEYKAIFENSTDDALFTVAEDMIRPEVYKTRSGEMSVDIPMYSRFVQNIRSEGYVPGNAQFMREIEREGAWLQWDLEDINKVTTDNPSAIIYFFSLLPGAPVLPTDGLDKINGSIYKQISQLRSSPSYMHGSFQAFDSEYLLAYARSKSGNPGYFVVYNPTKVARKDNFTLQGMPEKMSLHSFSDNFIMSSNNTKSNILTDELEVSPGSTVILSYVPLKSD
uniref:alpha-glucosidase n=1 Tax=Glossina palpalis gambiensis TaxID=67801 RepID=A0A1B0B6R9_9MUSC